MTCEERKDQLGLYAMQALDAEEQAEVRAHLLAGCPSCSGYLAEVEAVAALLPLGLTPVAPPAAVKDRLLERISDPRAIRPASPMRLSEREPARRGWGRFGDAFVGGAIAAALAVAAVGVFYQHDRQAIESLRTQVARHDEQLGSLQTSLSGAGETLRMLQSPAVQVVSAEGTEVQPRALARVFVDKSRGTLFFYGAGLKPLPAGKTYELWLINDQKKAIASGTFEVNGHGEASLERQVPPDAGKIALVAVTDEPIGGTLQPTGTIQLKGAVQ